MRRCEQLARLLNDQTNFAYFPSGWIDRQRDAASRACTEPVLLADAPGIVEVQDKTATVDERLQQFIKQFPKADTNGNGLLTKNEARAYKKSAKKAEIDDPRKIYRTAALAPTHADFSNGPHQRNTLDFWRATSESRTPLLIFFHGGSFKGGDKSMIQSRSTLDECLEAGISVVSVNDRFFERHRRCSTQLRMIRLCSLPILAIQPKPRLPLTRSRKHGFIMSRSACH